jgi:hypothetical protein
MARMGEEKSVQGFDGKAWREKTILKSEAYMGGWEQNEY